jgi:hypothetical protein
MSRILKSYLKRLTNLSSRNKSLLLTRLVSEQFADLHEADFLLNISSFELLHQVIQRRKRVPLCDLVDPRYDKVNVLSKKLRKIARTIEFIEEERGSHNLFIGYPFVRGKFASGQVVHAPLLFFPVALELDKGQWCLRCNGQDGPHLNRSFALAYGQFNEMGIPDSVLETDFDEFPTNITIFRTELYKWLKESPFSINFNQELFEDTLRAFEALPTKDLERLEKIGELKLLPEAVLGIFPQTGSYLEEDYQHLLREADEFSLAELVSTSDEAGAIREEDLLAPFALDASQEQALTQIKQGKSLVVQGPPGTGKSQLICNLMADYAARGKRVLLVCQKRAALDVVHERMKQAGFGDFTALIHDHLTDRSSLYRQMADQIEKLEAYQKQNYSLDAVYLEREFLKECRLTDRLVKDFAEFKEALYDESVAGASVKELYLTSYPGEPELVLTNLLKSFPLDKSEEVLRSVGHYFTYQQKLGPTHSWRIRKNFSDLNHVDLRRMLELLQEWPTTFAALEKHFERTFSRELSKRNLIGATQLKQTISRLKDLVNTPTIYKLFVKYLTLPEESGRIVQVIGSLNDILQAREGVEGYLENSRLAVMLKKVEAAAVAKQEVMSGMWWNWFSKDKEEVLWLCQRHALAATSEDLGRLAKRIKNRLHFEAKLSDEHLGFDKRYLAEPAGILHQYGLFLDDAKEAVEAVRGLTATECSDLVISLVSGARDFAGFQKVLQEGLSWVEHWDGISEEMDNWLVAEQFNQIVDDPAGRAQQLAEELKVDFENLVEIDRMWGSLSGTEQHLFDRLLERGEELGLTTANAYQRLLDNSLRLAWIEQVERRFPILRSVSSLKMGQWEEDLQRSVEQKQTLSAEIVKMKLREGVYGDVAKNRLGNTVTFRELAHQLTKKRRIWPIRKVVSTYSEEVFRLVPCWIVSPESASVIFPMQRDFFDLVIFDEASQCYAEYALPASYRAKQIVVAGDSKQLQPTDLYKVRYEEIEEEDEELPAELDAESLLDLAALSLPSHQLTGHYRSLSLDLIQFSNEHFYEGSLSLLPDFSYANTAAPGIRYHKVDGVWVNGTNHAEAMKVLGLVEELKLSGKRVGIVTFNYPQQQYIAQLLEDKGLDLPNLFVKNIENVQGDESDVIIFSIGYAPDPSGRLTMQFGTLNSRGGENRLNVAVTRAREKVHVVTSLLPSQLKVDQALFDGPRLLKAYLAYAQKVSEGGFLPSPTESKGGRSNWLLKTQLLRHIPEARFELPFADLTIKEEGQYQGLILTDDDQYHVSVSPKEPHAYLPILLKRKGWPFKRVYSREFWRGK